MKYAKGEEIGIEDYPELKGRANSRNIKFLLMLNVNHPFNFLAAAKNAQRLTRGHELTLGSGNSSFYLYFSKMLPGPIATIRFNGDRCSFIPHDFQYFPNLSAPLEDCINKKIVISWGGETQTITFKEWLSPLEEINRIMHMVEYLGPMKSPWDDDKSEI